MHQLWPDLVEPSWVGDLGRQAKLFRQSNGAWRIAIENADDFSPAHTQRGPQMERGDVTGADNADAKRYGAISCMISSTSRRRVTRPCHVLSKSAISGAAMSVL